MGKRSTEELWEAELSKASRTYDKELIVGGVARSMAKVDGEAWKLGKR